MIHVLLAANIDLENPAMRYRFGYPIEIIKKHHAEIEVDYLIFYSKNTRAVLCGSNQIKKIAYSLFDLLIFSVNVLFSRKKYEVLIVKNHIFPFGGSLVEKLFMSLYKTNKIILDLDDGLYLNRTSKQNAALAFLRNVSNKIRYYVKRSDIILSCNRIIDQDLKDLYCVKESKIKRYPTFAYRNQYFRDEEDISRWKDDPQEKINIVWLGSPHTQHHLLLCKGFFERIHMHFNSFSIILIGATDDFRPFQEIQNISHVRWSEENEIRYMKAAHFGLNPLKDDEFERRKCAFKIMQYYRAGIIPVASPVGINKDAVTKYGGILVSNFSNCDVFLTMKRAVQEGIQPHKELFAKTKLLSLEINVDILESMIM